MHWLETHWYRLSPLHLVLWPLSLLFGFIAAIRRWLYRRNILTSTHLPVPVVIVGNINVGGTGKTPCVIWLAQFLAGHGYRPGIITRGYGGRTRSPLAVSPDSDPAEAGDEAVLLARRCACPVWSGSSRVDAGRALLAANPHCNVLISDDGLQHYALQRDVELVVFDGERGCGNGMLLPAGPLREPAARLQKVDAIIINGGTVFPHAMLPERIPAFDMQLGGDAFYPLREPARTVGAAHFAGSAAHAVAGIGNPQRFFNHLHELGIAVTPHAFPDHHAYSAGDLSLSPGRPVIMTEKDAVKCERFAGTGDDWWALRIDAAIDRALGECVLNRIERR